MKGPEISSNEQRESWDRFYKENRRPWRGVGKLPGLDIVPGMKALDVGCGNGKTVEALLQAGALVSGVDFSSEAVNYCIEAFRDRAMFKVAISSSLPFDDDSFDIVTLVHVLEHLDSDQLADTVSEVERVLVPGGKILVRSFSAGDMRSNGSDSNVRGNGIAYIYRSLDEIVDAFSGLNSIRAEIVEDPMRFGGIRLRAECIFEKPVQ